MVSWMRLSVNCCLRVTTGIAASLVVAADGWYRARLGVGEGLPASWWNEKLQVLAPGLLRRPFSVTHLQVVVAKWFTELQKLSAARTDEPLEWDDEQQERLQVRNTSSTNSLPR